MRKRVAIDVGAILPTSADAPMTGIRRCALDFIRALEHRASLPFEVVFFGQKFRRPSLRNLGLHFPTKQLHLPRWETIDWIKERIPVVESLCRHDLFHAFGNYAALARPEKAMVTIHDAIFLVQPEDDLLHKVEARRIPPLARSCKFIVTCSQASKRDIIQRMGVTENKVDVVPWGVRHDTFRPEADQDFLVNALRQRFGLSGQYFLQVSCSMGRKNSGLILKAFHDFAKRYRDVRLVFAWRNPPPQFFQMKERLGLSAQVLVVRDASDDDLRLLYNGALALLFPSSYEGFGLPVLEAMACGTPVITTCLSSLPEVGGDAAVYIDVPDRDALVKAMTSLYESPEKRETLKNRGIEQASKFTWSSHVDRMVQVYQRCLDG